MRMKKLITLMLALAGVVGTVSAWDNVWLVSDLNGWNYSDHTNIFTCKNGNTFYIDIDGTNIKNGNFYFRFDVDATVCYPKTDKTVVTGDYGSEDDIWTTTESAGSNNAFEIEQDENAYLVRIIVQYYQDNGNWRWHVRRKIYYGYTIGFYNNVNWNNVYAYAYDNSTDTDNRNDAIAWKGTEMTQYNTTKYYQATVPVDITKTLKIIFNTTDNGSGSVAQVEYDMTENAVYNSEGIIPNQTISAGSNGVATYSFAYPLDFSSTTNISAYTVSALSKTSATLTKMNQTVPAETGLIIMGTSESISPVISGTSVGTNYLHASVTETVVENDYAYVLSSGKFHLATAGTIPANRAYLLAKDIPNEARSLSLVFGDESTGISHTTSEEWLMGNYYDLSGRRVAQPTKGMYIVNGKKVIVK